MSAGTFAVYCLYEQPLAQSVNINTSPANDRLITFRGLHSIVRSFTLVRHATHTLSCLHSSWWRSSRRVSVSQCTDRLQDQQGIVCVNYPANRSWSLHKVTEGLTESPHNGTWWQPPQCVSVLCQSCVGLVSVLCQCCVSLVSAVSVLCQSCLC